MAANGTPWYAAVQAVDFERSGLCRWGAESFLRRYKLHHVAWRFGLPSILVRMAGTYGERVIAASIVRNNVKLGQLDQVG